MVGGCSGSSHSPPPEQRARQDDGICELIQKLEKQLSQPAADWLHYPVPRPPRPSSSSSRCRGRFSRAFVVWGLAEACRRTLVSLSGEIFPGDEYSDVPCARRRRLPSHREANDPAGRMHQRLWGHAARLVKARRDHIGPTGVHIDQLIEFLGHDGGSMLHDDQTKSAYVPLVGHLVAEPPADSQIVDMMSALPSNVAAIYREPRNLFKEDADSILAARNKDFCRVLGTRQEYVNSVSYTHLTLPTNREV